MTTKKLSIIVALVLVVSPFAVHAQTTQIVQTEQEIVSLMGQEASLIQQEADTMNAGSTQQTDTTDQGEDVPTEVTYPETQPAPAPSGGVSATPPTAGSTSIQVASTTAIADPGGNVTVETSTDQDASTTDSSTTTLVFTADPGYQTNGKIVDGVNVGGDGGTTDTYTLSSSTDSSTVEESFIKGTDATLGQLTLDNGTLTPAFYANTYQYTVTLDASDTIPNVSVITNDPTATDTITQAQSIPGTATVVVTAQDGIETLTYTINFVTQ